MNWIKKEGTSPTWGAGSSGAYRIIGRCRGTRERIFRKHIVYRSYPLARSWASAEPEGLSAWSIGWTVEGGETELGVDGGRSWRPPFISRQYLFALFSVHSAQVVLEKNFFLIVQICERDPMCPRVPKKP